MPNEIEEEKNTRNKNKISINVQCGKGFQKVIYTQLCVHWRDSLTRIKYL